MVRAGRLGLWLVIALTAAAAAGADIQVNTYTPGDQTAPSVAIDAAGNFVVAWATPTASDFMPDVHAQRFTAAGARAGAEFTVNVTTDLTQRAPSVGMAADGRFVVAWHGITAGGDGFEDIYFRRYGSDGQSLAGEVMVNTYVDNREITPSLAMSADGRFALAWQRWNHPTHEWWACARAFEANGTPRSDEVVVLQAAQSGSASAAVDQAGNFGVAYYESASQAPWGSWLRMRRYGQTGNALGGAADVNEQGVTIPSFPAVGMDAVGNAVVAWVVSDAQGDYDVHGRRCDRWGSPVGGEFTVNTHLAGKQAGVRVAMNQQGQFLVAWNSDELGEKSEIFARCFDSDGAAFGPEFRVNGFTAGGQVLYGLALNDAGQYAITWQSAGQDGSGEGVFAATGVIPEPGSLSLLLAAAVMSRLPRRRR